MRLRAAMGVAAGVLACALVVAIFTPGWAQSYPNRPVRLVVPYAPGGGTDIMSRGFVPILSEHLGQSVVVDNRAGGGTTIGSDIVAKAAADGHTVLVNTVALAINATLQPRLPYDVLRDFQPVAQLAVVHSVLVLHPSLPPNTLREFIAYARAHPGELSHGSSGTGGIGHLSAELLSSMAGIKLVHVPYRGGGPLMTDLLGGHVKVSIASLPTALPHVRSGKLKGIAVMSPRRAKALPDIPTVAEAGIAGFAATNWQMMLLPARTAPAVVARLHAALQATFDHPAVLRHLDGAGFEPMLTAPAAAAELLRAEVAKWAGVIKAAGVTSD